MAKENKQDLPEKEEGTIDETNNEAIKEFLGEDKPVEAPEAKEVETITPEKPEEPEVPLEEIVKEVKEKTKEEAKEEYKAEVLKALGYDEKSRDKAKEEGYVPPWEKRGEASPATWEEEREAGYEYSKFRESEEEKTKQASDKVAADADKERLAVWNKEIDAQLDYLRKEGHLPEIDFEVNKRRVAGTLTDEDKKDPGIVAQTDLFNTMVKVTQEREAEGQPAISDIIHIFSRYHKPKKPAGAKAPVSGGGKFVETQSEEPPYEDIHNASFEQIVDM